MSDREGSERTAPLSASHATALRMRASGESDAAIAEALGLPIEAVETLAVIAARKAARAWGSDLAR